MPKPSRKNTPVSRTPVANAEKGPFAVRTERPKGPNGAARKQPTVANFAEDTIAVAKQLQRASKAARDKALERLKAPGVVTPEPVAGSMVAAFYLRTSGSEHLPKGTYGALLQTQAEAGTLKGRQCRHPHPTTAEAINCARAMASATKAA
jgi:hypothetical protein